MAHYGKPSYWEDRYTKDPEPFDWYQRYSGLRDMINQYVQRDHAVLIAGCGNSRLTEEMNDDGYSQIVNIDFSTVVINAMSERYAKSRPALQWQQMNVTSMDFPDESFDCVIAKATFDAILCGEGSTSKIASFCSEVSRVLKPNGVFIVVSYGVPENRLNYLEKEDVYGWQVQTNSISKPTISAAAIPTAAVGGADDAQSNHYVYVCTKGGRGTDEA